MQSLYLYLGIYIVSLIGIGYYLSRKETKEDFLISGRDRNAWFILLSKFAGAIGATWFITYTAYAYEYGFGVYASIIGFIAGYVIFALWAAPRIYAGSKEKKFYTLGDFIVDKTNNAQTKTIANNITIISQMCWLLVGVVGGAKIMNHFGLIAYETAVILTSGVVLCYILLAGYKAVIITDVIQSIIIILLLGFLSFAIIQNESVIDILTTTTEYPTTSMFIGFLLYGIMSVFARADRYQLCYAAKNKTALTRGIGFAIIPVIIAASFLLLVGLFMVGKNPTLDPGIVFIEALQHYLPATLLPFGIVMFFAGLMSSADTDIYAIVSHYTLNKKDPNAIAHIRKNSIILLVIITILACLFQDIVGITIFAAALSLVLSIPCLYIIKGHTNAHRFNGSIVGGILGLFIGIPLVGIQPTLVLTTLLGGSAGLLYNKKDTG